MFTKARKLLVLYLLGSICLCGLILPGAAALLAYAHNKYTNEALRKRGIKVLAFEGKYLADLLGGPHCLTMPLVRKSGPR